MMEIEIYRDEQYIAVLSMWDAYFITVTFLKWDTDIKSWTNMRYYWDSNMGKPFLPYLEDLRVINGFPKFYESELRGLEHAKPN